MPKQKKLYRKGRVCRAIFKCLWRRRYFPLLLVSLILLAGVGVFAGLVNIQETQPPAQEEVDVSSNEAISISEKSSLEVHYIDVGQGDCALLTCDGHAMLIDAGDDSKGTKIQAYLIKQGVEQLDYLVLSHPDADHIGGAPVIITKFDITQVFMPEYEKDSFTYEKVLDALEYRYMQWMMPTTGSIYQLGGAKVTFLGPDRKYEDSNNSSLILLIEHGKNTFLFTGDAEAESEKALVKGWGTQVRVDVLKAAHHGSKTSTGEKLLDTIKPQYAVISCGEDNPYGFPHAQTLNNLRARGIEVFRTDEQGSIVVTSDRETLTWNCPPSTTWQVGE